MQPTDPIWPPTIPLPAQETRPGRPEARISAFLAVGILYGGVLGVVYSGVLAVVYIVYFNSIGFARDYRLDITPPIAGIVAGAVTALGAYVLRNKRPLWWIVGAVCFGLPGAYFFVENIRIHITLLAASFLLAWVLTPSVAGSFITALLAGKKRKSVNSHADTYALFESSPIPGQASTPVFLIPN